MYEQIARNKRRTALLVVGALVFAGGLGFLFSYLIVNNGFAGLVIALIIVGLLVGPGGVSIFT